MLRFQPAVRIGFLTDPLAELLRAATVWSYRRRVDVDVNSINDPAPGRVATTLHDFDLAVDFDTDGDRAADLESLEEYLRATLPVQYDVVFEGDHVHVEWDARRGPSRRRP